LFKNISRKHSELVFQEAEISEEELTLLLKEVGEPIGIGICGRENENGTSGTESGGTREILAIC